MTPDALVIGSGPNGLVAANRLADAGRKVLVLEAHAERAGGAVGSVECTLPGFVHDVGAGFFPFSGVSPAFKAMNLGAHGLAWADAAIASCHPAPDGSCASICRDDDETAQRFGADGDAWRRLIAAHRRIEPQLIAALLNPLPGVMDKLRLGPRGLWHMARVALRTSQGFSRSRFTTEQTRRVMPGLGMHVDLGPEDRFGAALGYMLGTMAATQGNRVPIGGAQAITDALVRRLESKGGAVQLGAQVTQIIVRDRRAAAVRLADGTEIDASLVLANTGAPALFTKLLADANLPGRLERRMRKFPRGWGTFKVDWALDGPVPWLHEDCRAGAVVHAGDSIDDLVRFTRQVRGGQIPDNPYLVIGQQSLLDPSRAPAGCQALWAYSRVPSNADWATESERFADVMEQRIEGLAPGFRATIKARKIWSPVDLEEMDQNLVGGDLGGGSNQWTNQLIFRPAFPYFRYRTPVAGVYLCSSYAHPGAGVHGMCGFNAADRALRDAG
ncbi:MAG: phytoene dehydrogenase-like protein [Bradymonadia bacterium]|jgi:phytoene dehydrogenase-like protein